LTLASGHESILGDVLKGLAGTPKQLPARLLYDARGAQLFEAICRTAAYYPTRVEAEIFAAHRAELGELVEPRTTIVEFGAGEMQKVRMLLAAATPARYVAVDVAADQLLANGIQLAWDFPQVRIDAVDADYGQLDPDALELADPVLFFFPGASIGNFEPSEAAAFLRRIGSLVGPAGHAVIGVDLHKDPQALHRAYNDPEGITARFNLNVLARINRELRADFDLAQFEHEAFYNAHLGRIEMHLRSRSAQRMSIAGHRIDLISGETIHTESSYKYLPERFAAMARAAGFGEIGMWSDVGQNFAVFVLGAADGLARGPAAT
jgi:dimethylhistidine N-methyltransferase